MNNNLTNRRYIDGFRRNKKLKAGRMGVGNWIAVVLLFLYCLSLLAAFYWAFISSFKTNIEFIRKPFGFPKKFLYMNFLKAFRELAATIESSTGSRQVYLPELFFNTLLFSLGCTVIGTLTPCVTAYVVAKYKFFLKNILYSTVILTMLLPIVGGLASEMLLVRALGFYNNMLGIWLMRASFLGMYFLIFYAVFKGFSWDFAEAAFIDGASHFKVMFKIMLPMAKPTILAVGLLLFIGNWNDYMTQLIYLPSYPSISYALWRLQFSTTASATSIPIQLAGCIIVSIPILIIYLIFKNQLIGNLAVGGIKG